MKSTLLYIFVLVVINCNAGNNTSTEVPISTQELEQKASLFSKKYPDSSIYWINEDYLNEIKSGADVCECMSQNPFLILHIDSLYENMLIQSSTHHFGLETTAEVKLISKDTLNNHFITEKVWPFKQGLEIIIEDSLLTINYNKSQYRFIAQKLVTLNVPSSPKGIFVQSLDLFYQRNRVNAESLLAYGISKADDSLISFKYLSQLIDSNLVSLGCSDDYHYNSLLIKADTNRYFHVEFENDRILFYEMPNGRSRFEKIDLNALKMQTLYKN